MCTEGRVTVNGEKIQKPNRLIRIGDHISVVIGPTKRTVTVLGFASRRGSAPEAVLLYDEPQPPQALGIDDKEVPFHRPRGAGRPTKRDRRALEKLQAFSDSD